jgi:RecA/RadA recombinase
MGYVDNQLQSNDDGMHERMNDKNTSNCFRHCAAVRVQQRLIMAGEHHG